MSRRLPLLTVLLVAASPAPAAAQYIDVQLWSGNPDTAVAIPVGKSERFSLFLSMSGGVSAYSISIFLDDTRVSLASADSTFGYGLGVPTVTPGTNQVTISASGTGTPSSFVNLAILEFAVAPTAAEGSLLSFRVNSVTDYAATPRQVDSIRTPWLDICQAVRMWGDLDSSLTVTSRDALVALTYAVGLPVSGFMLGMGDVDLDGNVTSRDALFMLASAIGADPYSYQSRAGRGVPNRCAPLTPAPTEIALVRNSMLYRIPAGDTTAVPIGNPGATFDPSNFVRWNPAGTQVLATAATSFPLYHEVVKVTLATQVEDTLTQSTADDAGGAWDPTGARIAFFSTRVSPYEIWTMNADGSGQVSQTAGGGIAADYANGNVMWSPDGVWVAFSGYPSGGSRGLWAVRVDTALVPVELFPNSANYTPYDPAWSPASDSIMFQWSSRILVAEAFGAGPPVDATTLNASLAYPSWTTAGRMFRAYYQPAATGGATYRYHWGLRQPNGRLVRIAAASGNDGGATAR